MKTAILKMTILICSATVLMVSCNSYSPEKKAKEAKASVAESIQDLHQARMDSVNEFEDYQREAENKFREIDNKIASLKELIKTESKTAAAKYSKQLNTLEQKNDILKTGISEYKTEAKNHWKLFKRLRYISELSFL